MYESTSGNHHSVKICSSYVCRILLCNGIHCIANYFSKDKISRGLEVVMVTASM